ncbi:hypothetical protein N7478_007334 [Penicillium angulare]|uniref:uncharacterized protein n=1 Tax=Penicillium angulare TaxID=116970 RepID=UPI002540CCBB|nr:uncharacterized protein N7478_007334 [Penicillium angulare]KAJ5281962.1 hypothetical protein N7478_007334 [Penicillium angulare]
MAHAVFIHHGPYESIPDHATPGLRFLTRFLPAVDNLNPVPNPVSNFFDPNAPITIDNNPPNPAKSALPLLEVRSRHLSHFRHEINIAWDMDLSNTLSNNGSRNNNPDQYSNPDERNDTQGPLKRTVMFEATSETIFKVDPDQLPIKIQEFNILDLEGSNENELQVKEMRIYLEARPVQARAAALQMESAFGESQRETQLE